MKTMPFSSQFMWSPYEFALCLQKCLKAKALRPGMQVHATLLTSGTNMNILSLNSKLVGMYAGCADLKSARVLFQKIGHPNVFAFNWMVLGLAYNGYFDDALLYFRWMREVGHVGNNFTFSIVLKTCVGLMNVNMGKQVHAMVCEMGFQNDVSIANALIDMYGKCEGISYAHLVFDGMRERDVASWTSMICGFCNIGEIEKAMVLFERMKMEGLEPNDFTWNVILAAYARSSNSSKAFAFFERMKREGVVADVVTWNALISGFVQNHQVMEAFKMFQEMILSAIQPNQVTIVALLPAFGSAGFIKCGREIHGFVCRKGFDANVFIASALIDMYSKCGSLKDAQNVFDNIPCKNVASWNAMIDCYGKCGMTNSSLELFNKMQEEGLHPNEVTFTCVLSACSHSGSVQKGLEIFSSMKKCYGIEQSLQHYACVVDLLCRSGRTVEAYKFFKALPIQITESMAGAFLHGCKLHGRRDLAKMMAEEIMRLKLKRPGSFVTLSNIYAADGEWEEVENVRNVMKERDVHKHPGFSWIEKPCEILEGEKEKEGNNMESGLDVGLAELENLHSASRSSAMFASARSLSDVALSLRQNLTFRGVRVQNINIGGGVGGEIPDNKRLEYALQHLHGIGRSKAHHIVCELGVENKFVKDLSKRELYSIRELLSKYLIGNDLKKCVERDVGRLVGIQCYRGIRHVDSLPCRGQRTHTNARTRRNRKTLSGSR
ncbi:hypothetical protein VNO78_33075 [Psophocarpus tetragonolobus]|uniref:Ribosomal protein S13 n=1 Tax=Psophocarpus tetragonolobus TaxID=3891 RepID=A0AAN9NWM1_PSOTE